MAETADVVRSRARGSCSALRVMAKRRRFPIRVRRRLRCGNDERMPMPKTYDHAYFDKWYRHPRHAVGSRSELKRKVAMVVAVAEYYLGRPVQTVLDVGCGEAVWRAPLLALRPGINYRGLDASEYAVK